MPLLFHLLLLLSNGSYILRNQPGKVAKSSSTYSGVYTRLRATPTSGSIFDVTFLEAIKPYYSESTGTELMGPLIYSIIRSTRPKTIVELGAGYTTFWLCKAAKDAAIEWRSQQVSDSWILWNSKNGQNVVADASANGSYMGTNELAKLNAQPYRPVVHCVDIFSDEMGSHYSKKDEFEQALKDIIGPSLPWVEGRKSDTIDDLCWKLHQADWLEWCTNYWQDEQANQDKYIDLLWLDGFNPDTFERYWPYVNPDSGMAILHSTMNNHRNFNFIQQLKMEQACGKLLDYELLSLVEPHKWQQNSCTMIRKISSYNPTEHLVRGRA